MTVRQFAAAVTLVLGLAGPAAAQIAGPPFVFTAGTTISPTEVNTNFATLYANALNRTGGTMTGPILFSADNNHDIGANGTTRPRDLWLARNAAIGGTLAVTGASTFTGAVTIGSGAIAETAITNGTLLARVADPETISGRWTVTNVRGSEVSNAAPALWISETGAAADAGKWQLAADAGVFLFRASNDAESVLNNVFTVARSGATVTSFTIGAAQLLTSAGSAALPAHSYAGDPDSGAYSVSANTIGWATAGVARMSLSSAGLTINSGNLTVSSGGYAFLGESVFAGLGAPGDGATVYCSDCTVANPCAGAGTGALAKRLAGAWRCN